MLNKQRMNVNITACVPHSLRSKVPKNKQKIKKALNNHTKSAHKMWQDYNLAACETHS